MSNTKKIVGKVNAQEWVKANNGYPEVGTFSVEKDLQKFYKQLDTATLEDWAKVEGLTYKPCVDSEPIHRMRVCMSILYKHFPKQSTPSTKKKAKYADYTLEMLVTMCIEHCVAVEPTEDERIMRMRCIMNLRASGHIE